MFISSKAWFNNYYLEGNEINIEIENELNIGKLKKIN